MKVIVATDGTLDPQKAAPMAATLAGPEGEVLVLTVVEIPRPLLDAIRDAGREDAVDTSGVEYGAKASDGQPRPGWVGDDAMIARYVADQEKVRTSAMAEALSAAGVPNVRTSCRDSENVVNEVLAVVAEEEADVLCIGTLGLGRFEGLLGSISTKLARGASIPVLLIR